MERIEHIIDVLKANGIKIDKNFQMLSPSTSFQTNEIRNVANAIVNKLSDYIIIGVNNGFSSKLQGDIKKLMEIGGNLTDKNAPRKVEQYVKEIKKMSNTNNQPKVDFISPLKMWLTTTKEGLEVILADNKHENQISSLKKGIELITKIEQDIEKIVDRSSRKAFKCALDMTNIIIDYRNEVYKGSINTISLKKLESCVEVLEKWKTLNKSISIFNPAVSQKILKDTGYGFNEKDPFNNLSGNILLDEKVMNMEQKIQDYKASLQNPLANEIAARIKTMEEEKREIMSRSQNAKSELNKGMISMEEYEDILEDGFEQIETIEEELQELRETNKEIGQENRESSMSILRIETIISKIKNYRNNKTLYNILAENINFDTITTFLEGNLADPEMTENALKEVEYILETVEQHRLSKSTNTNMLKDALRKRREQRKANKEQLNDNGKSKEQIEEEKRKRREEMERKMGIRNPSQTNTENQDQNENNVNNEIKDIIDLER